jgi:cobalt-zinc-cadmium efflux system protein
MDLSRLRQRLCEIDDVNDIHDLHVWTLTSEMDVASVHLVTTAHGDSQRVLDQATALMREEFGIAHATLQVESETRESCAEIKW